MNSKALPTTMTSNFECGQAGMRPVRGGAPARILIVDDSQVIRVALSGLIRQDAALTVAGEASTGEMALEALKALQPDLVCLDVLMPGIGGLETLKRMREEHPALRAVIITGAATSEVVKEALALGAKGMVVKPFSAQKVLTVIHSALACGRE
jgi:two-component system, chemotaxis family, chemotaxis protein CheY